MHAQAMTQRPWHGLCEAPCMTDAPCPHTLAARSVLLLTLAATGCGRLGYGPLGLGAVDAGASDTGRADATIDPAVDGGVDAASADAGPGDSGAGADAGPAASGWPCTGPADCTGLDSCVAGVCACTPRLCPLGACGVLSDGCGGLLDCGCATGTCGGGGVPGACGTSSIPTPLSACGAITSPEIGRAHV
jgi:hypothetical protein